jgi:hypothetical protein
MDTLTCPLSLFRRALRALLGESSAGVYLSAGFRYHAGGREWLVHDLVAAAGAAPAERSAFFVVGESSPPPAICLRCYRLCIWGTPHEKHRSLGTRVGI